MMNYQEERARLVPPAPPVPEEELSAGAFLRAIRTNALTMWPRAAYEEDIVVRRSFGRSNVLVNGAEGIHRVLVENAQNYRRSPASIRILRPITGKGLLLSEHESWRFQRRTIAPALAPRVMPMLARHMAVVAGEHLAALETQCSDGPVNLLALLQSMTLDIAACSMFSLKSEAFVLPLRRMLMEYAQRFSKPYLLDMLLPPSVPTWRDLGRRRFQSRWMRLMESIMQTRLAEAQPDTPRDLFDLLRSARDPETGAGFSDPELRDQLATLLLAGHETTAVALFWTLMLLALDQETQNRVAQEAQDAGGLPEHFRDEMPALPYTRAVVSEALRLYPPAFVIVREAIAPDRLCGVSVPKRSVVMIAPWVLHRHRRLWPDPDVFDPSRFLPGAASVPRFAYLPFGVGPRVCVGAQFALTEATLVLSMMLRRFRFRLEDERPVLPVGIVTTQPDHQPDVQVTLR
jgi:unspecific monooxygenase